MKPESAKQYRKFAEECRQWAKQASTDLEHRDFLDMAKASLRAVYEYEGVPAWTDKPTARHKK